uniref:Uncharacterized protein n=1 Tax=Rhizophora mucronata TaxID=61149 RepID=A0A2P2NGF0_RHIMU
MYHNSGILMTSCDLSFRWSSFWCHLNFRFSYLELFVSRI